jgi:hypothetical protein
VSRINNDHQVAHFRLANGDLVDLFGPVSTREPYRRNVVVALGVEDVDKARTEMENAGVSFLTETSVITRTLEELPNQSGLADPGLTTNQYDLAALISDALHQPGQHVEFRIPLQQGP